MLDAAGLQDPRESSDGLDDDVECFYGKSDEFIGRSINVASLNKNLPRQDIKPSRHSIGYEPFDSTVEPLPMQIYGNSIFGVRKNDTFADRDLSAKLGKLKPAKTWSADNPLNRAKSTIIFCKEK